MLLTVKDLEAELQLGRTRTYELVRSGRIPVIRIGRVVRIPRDGLRRWVEGQAYAPEGRSAATGGSLDGAS
jgi:excisionase family DNA binding protein